LIFKEKIRHYFYGNLVINKLIPCKEKFTRALSTKLSTDSVDKNEKYFVNRDLAPMLKQDVRSMLRRTIFLRLWAGNFLSRGRDVGGPAPVECWRGEHAKVAPMLPRYGAKNAQEYSLMHSSAKKTAQNPLLGGNF
jgi:hypothetical protein